MSFAGVLAFLFADLIVLPIVAIYREYYGSAFALRVTLLMLVTMVLAALLVSGAFDLVGAIPSGMRPTRAGIFGTVRIDYKLALNVLGAVVFAAPFGLTARRGVTDPNCGMKVDRAKAVTRRRGDSVLYFCSERCANEFEATDVAGQGSMVSTHIL
jgi:YHS domain-containing protein